MIYYESTDFFLRVIRFDFLDSNLSRGITFRVLPMFHIGSKEYYTKIREEANQCDVVLYEGMALKKKKLFGEIGRYDMLAGELDLVTQRSEINPAELLVETIHADLDEKTAALEWDKLRFLEKMRYQLLTPLQFMVGTLSVTRQSLAKAFMTSAIELELAYGKIKDEKGTLENLIHTVRDKIVIDRIERVLIEPKRTRQVIGIIFGAGHMKVIGRYLIDKKNYRPANAEFIKVFDL